MADGSPVLVLDGREEVEAQDEAEAEEDADGREDGAHKEHLKKMFNKNENLNDFLLCSFTAAVNAFSLK